MIFLGFPRNVLGIIQEYRFPPLHQPTDEVLWRLAGPASPQIWGLEGAGIAFFNDNLKNCKFQKLHTIWGNNLGDV